MNTNNSYTHNLVKTYNAMPYRNDLLALHEDIPCLCYISGKNHAVKVINWFPALKNKRKGLFYSLFANEKIAVAIPGELGCIGRIDLISGEEKYIEYEVDEELKKSGYFVNDKDPFFRAFCYNDEIFVLGASYPGLLKISSEFNRIEYRNVLNLMVNTCSDYNNNHYFFTNGFVLQESIVYLPMGVMPAIWTMDLMTDEVRIVRMPDEINMIHGIVEIDNRIFLLIEDKNRNLLMAKWNEKEGIKNTLHIDVLPEEGCGELFWWEPIKVGGKTFIVPINKGNIYQVDYDSGKSMVCSTIMEAIGEWPDKIWRYMITPVGDNNGKLLFETLWDRKWHEYDPITGEVSSFFLPIIDDEYDRQWTRHLLRRKPYIDERNYPLNHFLRGIV